MKLTKALLFLLVTCLLVYALNRPWGSIPALGSFISPYTGFWQNGEATSSLDADHELKLDSLKEEVSIQYDSYGVPHIFARNNYDLYFAQGYVTARDRLWQMDLQTRAAAGRLSEVLGEKTLPLDLKARRLGLGYGAEANLSVLMSDAKSREALLAYSAGVNSYISQLKPKDYPVEFKLLGYAPEPWKPINTLLMLEQMTLTLAGGADDLNMSNVLKVYGSQITKDLFPDYPLLKESPVIPEGTPWNFTPLPLPAGKSSTENVVAADQWDMTLPKIEGIGSNNWAVGARKSATGYPILANDPHLDLTLPSIWYQVQLINLEVNVYGVSLPGIPGAIVGFNQNVAWGVTNVDADVLDLYQIRFKDKDHNFYWHDSTWKSTKKREEVLLVKGKDPIKEIVVYTHHGPVGYQNGKDDYKGPDLALKWIGHEPGNSYLTFHGLNRAKNYDDYREALKHYVGPAQNFIFADNSKNIAITANGKYPLKYREQGKFVLDGTHSADDWQGWIPMDQVPSVKNPPRDFVSSANQSSTDPSYPYYINWQFAPSERALRINERLEAMTNANADSLRLLQNDNFNILARTLLPKLLSVLGANPLGANQKAAFSLLEEWNYENEPSSIPATIFETWYGTLRDAIWEDDFGSDSLAMQFPSRDRTVYLLLNQPDSKWFDDRRTPQRETATDIIRISFKKALEQLTKEYGAISPKWQWAEVKGTEVRHLSRSLKPFNSYIVKNGGGSSIVNATSKHKGPSWRMVVELGPEPKGFGLFPGGQSGNPGSAYYLNFLKKWEKGELNELIYLKTQDQQPEQLKGTLTLKKAK